MQEALNLTLNGRGASRLGDGQMILGAVPEDSMGGSWSPGPGGWEKEPGLPWSLPFLTDAKRRRKREAGDRGEVEEPRV